MDKNNKRIAYSEPNGNGKFGEFGGQFVPETLMTALHELEETYNTAKKKIKVLSMSFRNFRRIITEEVHRLHLPID